MFTNDYVHVSGVNTRSNAVFNGNLKNETLNNKAEVQ